jgi:penicillin-binding protein 2
VAILSYTKKSFILAVFTFTFIVIVAQLANLQLFSSQYKLDAWGQGTFRKVIYPDRGIIFDRKKNILLNNATVYDLMVVPGQTKGIDTFLLCDILGIDTAEYKKRIITSILKNKSFRPSIFETQLNMEKMAKINENLYLFSPGFYLQQRSVREYPNDVAGNILGYLAEVDSNILKSPKYQGYQMGDYIGKTGLERYYEKVLMGQRGIELWKRDNKNRLTDRIENGKYDTAAIAGQSLYTSLDTKLQELGEKLLENKMGSIVAINPKTGGILCMVSSPNFKPKQLTGKDRKKYVAEVNLDPTRPLLNRTVQATYPPGSTFKTLQALVGLNEGVIDEHTAFTCRGAFYGCGGRPMGCLDYGTFSLRNAITLSDNTYFATVMQRVINNPKYPTVDSSLNTWVRYMNAFGLGNKLGVDVPNEKRGLIPDAAFYNKMYGQGKWNYCTFRSNSIGQGEITNTPLQVANEMAYLANKGFYYTPHLVDSIDGGDKNGVLDAFKVKHNALNIHDSIFEAVHDGMQGVVERGTGKNARVAGITICGKTGTVENYYRGVKQPNHAFFAGFAPRDNPKIAIMCVVENSGRFGGTFAAPIVGLMVEQYLKDSIKDRRRLGQIASLSKLNLIPKRIYLEKRKQDSILHAGDSAYLILKGFIKIAKDTLEIEQGDDEEEGVEKMKSAAREKAKSPAKKDSSNNKKIETKTDAILIDDKKKKDIIDSTSNNDQ